jgi:DNA-binding transcriptional LysR family regulator
MAQPLASLNLNLLVALDALLQQGSVTRAAKLVGVSQPAMSHSLAALRDHFHDPLLVRGSRGMELTPRAEQLAAPLRQALSDLERAIESGLGFDPQTTTRQFRVATEDFVAGLLAPALSEAIASAAPQASVVITAFHGRRIGTLLERGEAELAIAPSTFGDAGSERLTLRDDPFLCAVAAGHPLAGVAAPSLEAYLAQPHLLVSPTGAGAGLVDELLEARGLVRRVVCRVASFAVAPLVVARSGLLLTAPQSAITPHQRALGLHTFPPPLELPLLHLEAFWHRRHDADEGHRWLRRLARDAFVGLGELSPAAR